MPGATIEVTFDDAKVRDALKRLAGAGNDLTPLMRDIGEHLLNTTRERFVTQKTPAGVPWAPLSETTRGRKRRNKDKILTERGYLRGNLAFRAGRDSVEVGSPSLYAGTHQFGAKKGAFGSTSKGAPIPWGDIPARPFLGLSDDDEAEIGRLVIDYLNEQLSSGD